MAKTTYTIVVDDDTYNTLFYVSRNRWSSEYPDAYKFKTEQLAKDHLANIKRMNPELVRYWNAYVR